jgi:hypothetical protein
VIAVTMCDENEIDCIEWRPRTFELRARRVGGQRVFVAIIPKEAVDEHFLISRRQHDAFIGEKRDVDLSAKRRRE